MERPYGKVSSTRLKFFPVRVSRVMRLCCALVTRAFGTEPTRSPDAEESMERRVKTNPVSLPPASFPCRSAVHSRSTTARDSHPHGSRRPDTQIAHESALARASDRTKGGRPLKNGWFCDRDLSEQNPTSSSACSSDESRKDMRMTRLRSATGTQALEGERTMEHSGVHASGARTISRGGQRR